jgi:putative membrane protein
MRHRFAVLALLALAAVALVAATAGNASSQKPLSALDKHYLQSGAMGDHFEITGGKLAASRGTNAKVKALGKRLAKDHAKSLSGLRKLGHRFGVSIPKSPSPTQRWELGVVKSQPNGKAFDRAYTSLEVADHKQDIEDAKEEIHEGSNAKVRADAKKELPELRTHLKLSRAAAKSVG